MKLELDTSILKKIKDINISQFVFITLLLDNNQKSNQGIATIVSRVSDRDIEDLIEKGLIAYHPLGDKAGYKETEALLKLVKQKPNYFKDFELIYPTVIDRPDGTTAFLKTNRKKCEIIYNKIVGNDEELHSHILKCLNYELSEKITTGKLGYMKTMYKWLTNHDWEDAEAKMKEEITKVQAYGTTVI